MASSERTVPEETQPQHRRRGGCGNSVAECNCDTSGGRGQVSCPVSASPAPVPTASCVTPNPLERQFPGCPEKQGVPIAIMKYHLVRTNCPGMKVN